MPARPTKQWSSTWELIKRSGAAVNLAPRSDAAFGLGSGFPPIDQARAAGLVPGLSGDSEVSYALCMFTEIQTLLNKHRGSVFGRVMAGNRNSPDQLAPSDVLRFATLGGAANAGLSHKVGSLTPGKDADITLIRATDVDQGSQVINRTTDSQESTSAAVSNFTAGASSTAAGSFGHRVRIPSTGRFK